MLNSVVLMFILHKFKKSSSGHLLCKWEPEKPVVKRCVPERSQLLLVPGPAGSHGGFSTSHQSSDSRVGVPEKTGVQFLSSRNTGIPVPLRLPAPGTPSVIWWLLIRPLYGWKTELRMAHRGKYFYQGTYFMCTRFQSNILLPSYVQLLPTISSVL